MNTARKNLGVLTAGGDCPGLNAVIRAVSKTAMNDYGMNVIGFRDGFFGLVKNKSIQLHRDDVSGILTRGGTILGTSNRHNPFRWAEERKGKIIHRNMSRNAVTTYRRLRLDGLVCIGGEGTMAIAGELIKCGLNVVGVPKTIDNDLAGTDQTFGFDTAVQTATEAIDKLHDTAQSHHRVMIVETMGRYAGWLTLAAGIAGGGDIILLPEIHYDIRKICAVLAARTRFGKRFSIVVVAEGARPHGGDMVVSKIDKSSHDPIRLGGIGQFLARQIEETGGLETRVTVLGHLQRGGTPTSYDRVLCTRYGVFAAHLAGQSCYGNMAALRGTEIVSVPIASIAGKVRTVPLDHPLIATARSVGTCFGD